MITKVVICWLSEFCKLHVNFAICRRELKNVLEEEIGTFWRLCCCGLHLALTFLFAAWFVSLEHACLHLKDIVLSPRVLPPLLDTMISPQPSLLYQWIVILVVQRACSFSFPYRLPGSISPMSTSIHCQCPRSLSSLAPRNSAAVLLQRIWSSLQVDAFPFLIPACWFPVISSMLENFQKPQHNSSFIP